MEPNAQADAIRVPAAIIMVMLVVAAGVANATGHPVMCLVNVALCRLTMIAVSHAGRKSSREGTA